MSKKIKNLHQEVARLRNKIADMVTVDCIDTSYEQHEFLSDIYWPLTILNTVIRLYTDYYRTATISQGISL